MKMKFKSPSLIILLLTACLLWFYGCKDIQEEDISDKTVHLIAPANGTNTTVLSQSFWWGEVEGASSYRIQIASPSFMTPDYMVLDSTISGYIYDYTLNPGTYEWRVKALNGAYETPFSTFTLSVDSTPDISGQQVILISPTDNYITNTTNFTFQWDTLYNADEYKFELRSPDWNGNRVLSPQVTLYDTISLTLDEGFYAWGVQAQNLTSNSPFSSRSLVVDTTSPGAPTLIYPANGVTINDTILTNSIITFEWLRGVNVGSTIYDSLYISTDSLFQSGNIGLINTSDSTYSFTMTTSGSYFWKVRSRDAANNYGNYSITRKFIYEE